jgi:hypothetical protein
MLIAVGVTEFDTNRRGGPRGPRRMAARERHRVPDQRYHVLDLDEATLQQLGAVAVFIPIA